MNALVAKDLSLVRGERTILAGIDLSLRPGELVLLAGRNGAGSCGLSAATCGNRIWPLLPKRPRVQSTSSIGFIS